MSFTEEQRRAIADLGPIPTMLGPYVESSSSGQWQPLFAAVRYGKKGHQYVTGQALVKECPDFCGGVMVRSCYLEDGELSNDLAWGWTNFGRYTPRSSLKSVERVDGWESIPCAANYSSAKLAVRAGMAAALLHHAYVRSRAGIVGFDYDGGAIHRLLEDVAEMSTGPASIISCSLGRSTIHKADGSRRRSRSFNRTKYYNLNSDRDVGIYSATLDGQSNDYWTTSHGEVGAGSLMQAACPDGTWSCG
jgi:hypothetical protein